jgi:uncharacterized protein (DUF1330 family)
MNEKATLVVTAIPKPNEMESVQVYLQAVMPLFLGAGGKLVKRLKVGNVISGKPSGMVLVMDFDSDETITALFASDEYAALIPVREKGFAEMNILLTHEM